MLGSGQSGSNLGIVDYCIVGFIHDQIAQSLEAPGKLNLSAPKNQISKKAPRRRDSGASASVKSQDKSSRALARGVCCTTCSVEQWRRRGRRRRGQETGGVKY